MGFAAQAGGKAEAVIACGCWCRMCPSPCVLGNFPPLATCHQAQINCSSGRDISHLKNKKKDTWEISEDLHNYIPQDVGLITQEVTSTFFSESVLNK